MQMDMAVVKDTFLSKRSTKDGDQAVGAAAKEYSFHYGDSD